MIICEKFSALKCRAAFFILETHLHILFETFLHIIIMISNKTGRVQYPIIQGTDIQFSYDTVIGWLKYILRRKYCRTITVKCRNFSTESPGCIFKMKNIASDSSMKNAGLLRH